MKFKVTVQYGTYSEMVLNDVDEGELTEMLKYLFTHSDIKCFEVVPVAVPVDPVQPTEEDDF